MCVVGEQGEKERLEEWAEGQRGCGENHCDSECHSDPWSRVEARETCSRGRMWRVEKLHHPVEISQLIAKGALAMQAFSVRPSTVRNMVTKVRFLRQWRPVLSRCGMRGVRPEAGFWQRKWTVQGNPGPARLTRPVEGGDDDEETPVPGRGFRFDESTSPQEPEPVPFRPSRRAGVGASILRVHSTVHARCRAKWFSCSHSQSQLSWDSEEGHGGRYQLWPKRKFGHRVSPSLAKPSLAKRMTKSGQTKFGQHHILVFEVGWGAGSGGRWSGRGPEGEGLRRERAPNLEKVGGPEGLRPRRVEAPKGGGPKISRFFFLLLPQFSFFLPSLGGLLVEFLWCFAPGP